MFLWVSWSDGFHGLIGFVVPMVLQFHMFCGVNGFKVLYGLVVSMVFNMVLWCQWFHGFLGFVCFVVS